jgi:HEAT repeat protein
MQGNNRIRWFVLLALLLVAALCISVLARHEREEEKQRQLFDAWVRRDEGMRNWWEGMPAGIEPWAVPFIADRVQANNSLGARIYRKVWPKLPKALQSHLSSPKPLNMEPTRDALVMFQLVCTNAEGTRLLLKELHNGNSDVRGAAVRTLSDLAGKTISTNEAAQACLPLLRDESPHVQIQTAIAFGRLGAAASNAVPLMIPLLNANEILPNGQVFLRANTALALAKIGPPASNAVPQLKSLMTNGDTSFQHLAAAFALWRITSNVSETLPVFIKDMAGYDRKSSFFPAAALSEMGPLAKAAYPALAAEAGKGSGSYEGQTIAAALKAIDHEAAARDGIK